MSFWPWISRKLYDSLYQSYQDLEADRNAFEKSSLEHEKQAMLNHNKMVARERERDQARDEVNDLLAERNQSIADLHHLEQRVDELEAELADRTRYELVAVVTPSTQGVHRTPCMRFVIREVGREEDDPLCVSDVNGLKDKAEALDVLNRLENCTITIKVEE